MPVSELKERLDKMKQGEMQFSADIEEITYKYQDLFIELYEKNENIVELFDVAFDIYLYEYIWRYEHNSFFIEGIILNAQECIKAISWEHDDKIEVLELENKFFERIQQYRNDFKFPQFDSSFAGKALFEEIMSLENTNDYKLKLWFALLYPIYEDEELNEFERQMMINAVLVDYDTNYKIPQEVQYLNEERYRIRNHIPAMNNVKVGDTWEGGRREAKFVRALGLEPHKAGSHQRIAQMKSIKRSCRWEDDGKTITLVEIYPERLEKEISVRTGKYENAVRDVLIYHLNRLDGIFETSVGKCFVNMYSISQNYKKVGISKYIELLGIEDNKVDEITEVFNEYHNITHKRLKEILVKALQYLENKKYIRTTEQLIIVKNGQYIPIDNVNEIDLSVVEAEEMIEEANEYALKELQKKYDKLGLLTMANVMENYKYSEFKSMYDEYIQNNYGWDYTYKQIIIYSNEELEGQGIDYDEYVDAKQKLNKLLVDAVKTTMVTKYENLLQKHEDEENRIDSMISDADDITELINLGIMDKEGVVKNTQFKYPESFIKYIDVFIDRELKI